MSSSPLNNNINNTPHTNNNSDDEELRSLLSGISSTNSVKITTNPHRKKQQRATTTKRSKRRMDGPITSLDNISDVNLDICKSNSNDSRNDEGSLESVGVGDNSNNNNNNNNNNNSSGSSNNNNSNAERSEAMPRTCTPKRLLYILGSALLALAVFGPGSPLFYSNSNSLSGGHVHGDRHHTLNTAADHNAISSGAARGSGAVSGGAGGRATGSKKHEKFGSRQKHKKNPNNIDNSPIHSDIKEAIDNIDKVFLGKKKKKNDSKEKEGGIGYSIRKKTKSLLQSNQDGTDKNNKQDDDSVFPSTTEPPEIPVIHADDDTLPSNAEALDAYTNSLPASDALECRASVIAFVINATDVRDECEGLRKAFDKTCSVNSNVGSGAGVASGRRKLNQWGLPEMAGGWSEKIYFWGVSWFWNIKLDIQAWNSWISRWVRGDVDDAFLFAEDEIASDRVWSEAQSMIEMGVDLQALAANVKIKSTSTHRRRLDKTLDPNMPSSDAGKSLISIVEERKAEDAEEEEEAPAAPVKKEEDAPKISLLIPTDNEHVSEELLNDALMLQEAKDEPKPPPPQDLSQLNPQSQPEQQSQEPQPEQPITNNTASEEAARDAAESANSIRTATDAVKNMMMDPKSVEARTCCASILSVFHEHCDPSTTGIEDYSDRKLLVIVFVVTVCGIIKSIIRYFNIRWLPEAGGCILVGVMGYLILQNVSYVQYAFDGDMFLRIMVPPIVFEAAVKINKRSFQRHVIPITIYAIVGTLASTALTATILYKGSQMVSWCETIPVKESLIFGSLISSIDPIAVLSVLNNMGMTDSDTIYVLIFGESLLNDGIAIVLFQTLVHFLDEALVIDGAAVIDAIMHFVVVALGSLTVGVASGACATVYFAVMHGMQTPMVELISFLAWAFIPYFICDMVEWSGIVAIVANGFVMDLYIVGQRNHLSGSSVDDEIDFLVNGNVNGNNTNGATANTSTTANSRGRSNARQQCRSFFTSEGHLSALANTHVHFVIEIFATLMETAIFAYLGLFLFSSRYHWNKYLTIISIFATVMGRVIMIPILSHISNIINRMVISRNRPACIPRNDNNENVHVDRRMQVVLIFAGLRGAMSFALVEHIPLYDTITGQGTRLKPELKAMTSASIIFTVFILGGATSYLMERIGYSINPKQEDHDAIEVIPLVRQSKPSTPNSSAPVSRRNELASRRSTSSNSVRQRGGGTR